MYSMPYLFVYLSKYLCNIVIVPDSTHYSGSNIFYFLLRFPLNTFLSQLTALLFLKTIQRNRFQLSVPSTLLVILNTSIKSILSLLHSWEKKHFLFHISPYHNQYLGESPPHSIQHNNIIHNSSIAVPFYYISPSMNSIWEASPKHYWKPCTSLRGRCCTSSLSTWSPISFLSVSATRPTCKMYNVQHSKYNCSSCSIM